MAQCEASPPHCRQPILAPSARPRRARPLITTHRPHDLDAAASPRSSASAGRLMHTPTTVAPPSKAFSATAAVRCIFTQRVRLVKRTLRRWSAWWRRACCARSNSLRNLNNPPLDCPCVYHPSDAVIATLRASYGIVQNRRGTLTKQRCVSEYDCEFHSATEP